MRSARADAQGKQAAAQFDLAPTRGTASPHLDDHVSANGAAAGSGNGRAHGNAGSMPLGKLGKSLNGNQPGKPGGQNDQASIEVKPKKAHGGPRRFLKAALESPRQVGAVIPSSPFLAKAMMKLARLDLAQNVVEYGPGTGSITKEILRHLQPGAKFFAVELNDTMAASFAHNYPNVKLHHRSIADIEAICVEENLPAAGGVDVIISGIPWAALPEPLQAPLLAAAVRVLRPGGLMLTYGYHGGLLLKSGRAFAKLLPKHFSRVTRSAPIWLNVPPAFVYRCEK